jgi:hypothetical protein
MSTNPSDELADTLSASHGDSPVTVYSGELIMSTDNSGPPEGPKHFDYRLDFQTPYFYHPDEGNLIWDIEAPFGYQPALLDDPQNDPEGRIVEIGNTDLSDKAVYTFTRSIIPEFTFESSDLCSRLQAGDADRDLDFDQLDLVQVQIAAKFLSGQPATWGEGDWDGAPGGNPASPPAGNGQFDQLDIVKALTAGLYLTGPYAAVLPDGNEGDDQTSVGYNAQTGELWVDAPAAHELTSINIDSAAGIFTGSAAQNLGGSFDNDSDINIFKATFGSSFGSLSFGNVAQAGLSEQFVLSDLSVVGSLAGGGALGDVDLIYVPEPSAMTLTILGFLGLLMYAWRRQKSPRCETIATRSPRVDLGGASPSV